MNWMRWASAAAVVFVLGWWGMNEIKKVEYSKRHEIVLATYSTASKPVNRGTRGEVETKDLEENAYEAFFTNDWQVAKNLFLQLEKIQGSENLARRYLGHIYFIKRDYRKSIEYFQSIKNAGYEVQNANQMMVNLYFILGNNDEMEKLLSNNSGLNRPKSD